LIANSVERLIPSWAQSSSVVSQGFEGDMAAGAAGVEAAGEATQGGDGVMTGEGNLRNPNDGLSAIHSLRIGCILMTGDQLSALQ
jgi:hypothetical protein